MLNELRHLFTPHHTNNHRPKILHPTGLALLIAIYIVSNSSLKLFALYDQNLVKGNVLGYASNIATGDVVSLTNQERANRGLPALTENSLLSEAAAAKAADMFTFDYWAHNNPQNGRQPWAFIKEAGYTYRYAGENLARDFNDTPDMVAAWMASPSHRDNIISARYQETGVAVVNGQLQGVETTLVVQMFGTKATQQAVSGTKTLGQAQQVPLPSSLPTQNSQTLKPIKIVQAADSKVNPNPMPPLAISKSIALSILILLSLTLFIDYAIIKRRKIIRLSSKNLAHLAFILAIIIVVIITNSGGIL